MPQQQPGDDNADHAGGVDLLGDDVRRERRQEAQPGVEHRVGHVLADEADDHEEHEPHEDAAAGGDEEVAGHDLPGHRDRGRRDGRVQRDQCGRVVEQRLPLEDRDDAPRKADPAADRGRGHSVRRRDDRTDREGRPPAEVGQERMHQDRDTHGGEGDQADRQQQDRATVRVEVDQARLERCGVQQRREQAEEHHLRLQLHVRDERQVRADHSHHDQDEGGGEVEPRAETGDRDDHGDDPDERQDDMHALIIANAALGIPRRPTTSLREARCPTRPGTARSGRSGPCRCRPPHREEVAVRQMPGSSPQSHSPSNWSKR